jgi:hypothetical protein
MTAIDNYVKYWDDWHEEWYSNALTSPPTVGKVKEWITPIDNGGNENPIWQYFPEPYWGNPYSENVAVFLNLNPGGGGDCQDVLSVNQPSSILYNTYSTNKLYSRTVEQLSKNLCYVTTNWFDRKRVNWLKKLMNCSSSNIENKYSIDNIFCADLIPWHTPTFNKKNEKYIIKHKEQIFDHVIKSITSISQQATLKGLVFAKGRATNSILLQLIGKPTKQYKNGKFEINLFNYNNAVILVFVGGQGMLLPNPCNKNYILDSNKNKVSINDIVQQIQSDKTK